MAEKRPKKEEGVTYLSSTGDYYSAPEITAEKLKAFRDGVYGRGLAIKQKNLIFVDKYSITVLDPKGERDEDLENTIMQMCDSKGVRLWANMQRAYMDIFWYGIGIFNPVWDYEGAEYKLLKLRHLPASTFSELPASRNLYSQILQGITLNDKSEIEFYQTKTDPMVETTLIKNIFYVKDPTAPELGGESIVLPLVPVIEMLKFAWKTQMQQTNRTGAKILFMRITDPKTAKASNGNVSDLQYAAKILQSWGKDTAFTLRENMEIIDPGIRDDSTNIEVIEALHNLLIDYLTPTSFIRRDGSFIGGSEAQREDLLLRYVKGVHTWLEDQFEMLLMRYLEYNEYEGYSIKLKIPSPTVDHTETHLKQAVEGFKSKSLSLNEIRTRLEAEPLDEKGIAELMEYYAQVAPPQGTLMKEIIENAVQTNIKKETPAKVRKSMEEELGEIADKLSDDIMAALKKEET